MAEKSLCGCVGVLFIQTLPLSSSYSEYINKILILCYYDQFRNGFVVSFSVKEVSSFYKMLRYSILSRESIQSNRVGQLPD